MDLDQPHIQGKLTDTPELGAWEWDPSWAPIGEGGDDRLVAMAQRGRWDGIVIFENVRLAFSTE